MNTKFWNAKTIAILAIMVAIIRALTMLVRIPTAPTRGYINLGDAAIYFAAYAFGPVIGGIAGGLGTGLADMIGGYPQWMVLSFFIHGLQGLAAGYIGRSGRLAALACGRLAGGVIMVGGYFLAACALYGMGPALTEIPGNMIQSAAGWIIAVPLFYAVKKAYPPLLSIGQPVTWTRSK